MSIFCFKEKDNTVNVTVSGYVSKEPELVANGKKVRFSLCYGGKKDSKKYMTCEVWQNHNAAHVAGMLEKFDVVQVSGVDNSREYNGKTYHTLEVDFIAVLGDGGVPSGQSHRETPTEAENGGFEELQEDGELPF